MKRIDVRIFGAKGDGITLNTDMIQKAIDSLEKGDTLVFSEGIYLTGTIALKSDITILIEGDAEICGSRCIDHYRDCGFYHNEMIQTVSLIYALNSDNITFCGTGKIQLSGDAFVDFNNFRLPKEIDPSTMTKEYIEQTVVAPRTRPTQPIFFNECKNIRFEGIKIFNAPCWGMVFSNCENITLENIYVDNHKRIPNNDGVHFSASKNITVHSCTFLCGDDCIATTCITNWDGVCENIEISDCLLSSRSAAIRMGHLGSHVRNVCVKNIKVMPSSRAFIIFAGDNGRVENVHIENLVSETCIHAGAWWGKGEGFVICACRASGEISDITIRNCNFVQENPSIIAGEDYNICNITLENCNFSHKDGHTHPYYRGKLDLQPNIPKLEDAPFKSGELLYIMENSCKNLLIS